MAMKVAKEKSKQWILTNYLNTIYMGAGAYGVEAAAQTYYGKKVSQLDVAQAAVIAAIIQQPSTYPLPQYRPELISRSHYVLSGLVQMGKLTAAGERDGVPGPRRLRPADRRLRCVGSLCPQHGLQRAGRRLSLQPVQIYTGGYTIRTSIDNAKMAELYAAVRDNEAQIDESSFPFDPPTCTRARCWRTPPTAPSRP